MMKARGHTVIPFAEDPGLTMPGTSVREILRPHRTFADRCVRKISLGRAAGSALH